MLKIFIKLMVLLVVLALAGPFMLHGPNGRPLLTLSDLKLTRFNLRLPWQHTSPQNQASTGSQSQHWIHWSRDADTSPDQLTPEQLAQLDLQEQPNIYYRWRDNNGVWQFSTLPNRNTLNYVVRTNPDANVLKSLDNKTIDRTLGRARPDDKKDKGDKGNITIANTKDSEKQPPPTTIPVSEIPKLLQKAKDVQKILAERAKKMEELTR